MRLSQVIGFYLIFFSIFALKEWIKRWIIFSSVDLLMIFLAGLFWPITVGEYIYRRAKFLVNTRSAK